VRSGGGCPEAVQIDSSSSNSKIDVFVGWITKEGGATRTENQNQKSNMEFFYLTFLRVQKNSRKIKEKQKTLS